MVSKRLIRYLGKKHPITKGINYIKYRECFIKKKINKGNFCHEMCHDRKNQRHGLKENRKIEPKNVVTGHRCSLGQLHGIGTQSCAYCTADSAMEGC